jgi:hypothetical protein
VTPGRNRIIEALLAQFRQNLPRFALIERRRQHWSKVDKFPALFVRHINDAYPAHPSGLPGKITLWAEAWIYSRPVGPEIPPEIELNDLLDEVEAAIAPVPVFNGTSIDNVQSLGGLVTHCWIEGRIIIDPGDIDGRGKAVVPIAMLAPQ